MSLDTDVLIIGAGMSGLGMAIQLQKNFPQANYELVEKMDNVGGTWWANTYPACGCDVASHLYSYSFELNPDWSRKYATQPEIMAYFRSVAEKHNVTDHVTYHSTVQSAAWDETTGIWRVTILNHKTNRTQLRKTKILISAVGALSIPKECDIKGAEKFRGKLFHSAKWDHTFNWADKDVVVVGNGCSATQFVPALSGGDNKARMVTQFSRGPHWLFERENPEYSSLTKWIMRYVPLVMKIHRAYHYYLMESSFPEFYTENRKQRKELVETQLDYLRRYAPAKYHDALIPKTEILCKRKVLDTDYLACLHQRNMELIADDPIEEITETGVTTKSGREVKADAIILATGFQTQQILYPMEIKGENGIALNDHWSKVSNGVPQAYFGTCISKFPNFFVMMGPNTATGHLSVIYTTECQINFTIRVMRRIMKSLYPSSLSSLNPFRGAPCDAVTVTQAAEQEDNTWIQSTLKRFVWATGCTSWYVNKETGVNTMLYPDWQWKYWLRSIFIPFKSDFVFKTSKAKVLGKNYGQKKSSRSPLLATSALSIMLVAAFGVGIKYDMDAERIKDLGIKGSQELGSFLKSTAGRVY